MLKTKFRNDRLEALHGAAAALHKIGELDKATMRDIEAFSLTAIEPLSGPEIQAIREKEGISQAVFAHHLNVGTKLVSDWERGTKRPSGPSLKLLFLVKTKGLETIA